MDEPKPTDRVWTLDGLRAVAAAAVFLSHWIGLKGSAQWVDWLPISVLWSGELAVVFFMVLSGFALSRSLRHRPPSVRAYMQFITRRAFRIYPVYWMSLALALALRYWLFSPPGLAAWSEWTRTMWTSHLDLSQLLRQIALVLPGIDTRNLNPVVWVLVQEVRLSFLMPIVVWSTRRSGLAREAALLLASLLLGAAVDALMYLPLFVVGHVLSEHYESLVYYVKQGRLGLVTLTIGVALSVPLRAAASTAVPSSVLLAGAVLGVVAILIATSAVKSLEAVLSSSPLLVASSLSYAFYLVHLPVLLGLASVWPWATTPGWLVLGIVCLAVSAAASWVLESLKSAARSGATWRSRQEVPQVFAQEDA